VKDRVLLLFQTSLDEGELPTQWKNSTLGKALESVVAERISHAVETFGLLPTNHFGARKKRSTEQALVLLQEHIYNT
jgi:hypothetical protein